VYYPDIFKAENNGGGLFGGLIYMIWLTAQFLKINYSAQVDCNDGTAQSI